MAKLPQYEQSASLMAGIDTIQTPNIQEGLRRSQSIEGSLDALTKFASDAAERKVVKEAMAYTVANPLTTKQLEDSKVTGVNPIEAALNGGLKWNEAVRALYAQQASAELTNSAYKHYESVYERVQSGDLTDPGLIQRELETPLKSWSGVIAKIDPEAANAFYKSRISDGNTYYKASLKEVRKQEQDRQDLIAEDTMYGMIRQMELDVRNQEPSVVFAKYLNGMEEANGLFTNSANKKQFKNKIEEEFSKALFRHIATELPKEFPSIDQVYDQLDKGQLGKYTEVWTNLRPSQKNTLQSTIESKYSKIEQENKAALKGITSKGKEIRDALEEGANPDNWRVEIAQYQKSINNLSGAAKIEAEADLNTTKSLVQISTAFQNLTLPQMQATIARWDNDPENYPKAFVQLAQEHYDKLEEYRNKDLAAYTITRAAVNPGDLDLLLQGDSKKLQASFEEQFNAVRSQPDYIPGSTNFLTKQQEQRLTRMISSEVITKDQKIAIASQIVDAFGMDSLAVFNQVSPKDPVFAHVGALAVNGTDPNTLATILEGQQFMLESNLNMESKRKKSRSALALIDAVSLHPGESDRILKAADAYYARLYPDAANSTTVNDTKYKEAIMAVTGAEGTMGGLSQVNDRFVMIHQDMNFEEFPKYFETADANDFLSAVVVDTAEVPSITAPNGKDHITEDLANATPKRIGDHYILLDKNGHPFTNESNMPIVFDGHVLQQIYKTKEQFGSLQQEIPLAGKKRVRTGFSSYRYERMGGAE